MAGHGLNGSLQGQPPEKFTGNRKKMKDWLKQFKLFTFVNFEKVAIVNPLQRIALALTYIQGEKVREWANQQLELAND